MLFRRDHHGAKRRKSTIDAKEPETSMPRLGIEKPIEWIAVTLTQFARDEQRLHLNRQRTQAVGERLIG